MEQFIIKKILKYFYKINKLKILIKKIIKNYIINRNK